MARNNVQGMTQFVEKIVDRGIVTKKDSPDDNGDNRQEEGDLNEGV